MNYIIFCLIIVIVSTEALNDSYVKSEWLKYQKEYGRNYKSPVEFKHRYEIFKENLEKIQNHNLLYNQGKSTHMEGVNQFTDWTNLEFLDYLNGERLEGPKLWGETFEKIQDFKAPLSVDYRTQYAVTEVKNQRDCRSSYSFSAIGALEGQLGLRGNLISLSEQNLIDCSDNSGCSGGLMTTAYDYIRSKGIQSEISYPYINAVGSCFADESKILTRISNFVKIPPNEETLQQAIAIAGPISVAIHATENLQRYKGGILDDDICKNDTRNHGVLIVGYGSEGSRDYYLIKNSWGESWGESGYLKLPRNANNKCGIASTASYPVL